MYVPGNPPSNPADLGRWLREELERLAGALQAPSQLMALEISHAPPQRLPADRVTLAFADGTNWNPGAGAGVYAYYSGTWNKL